jgi:two-component system LytT family response regulator
MRNKTTCIIIDDEPKAIELLVESLNSLYADLEIVNTYTSPTQALNALRSTHCDIVFMDISMPGKNGLELLRLAPDLKSEVIFITAHSEYALNAFKFSAAGYIMKPIDDADIVVAVDHAIERIKYKKLAKQNTDVNPKLKIGIPDNNGIDYVMMDEILYFESVNRYTNVVLKGREIVSSYNLGKYKALTEGYFFHQVHRSYIVNLNSIIRYESSGIIIMSNKKEIPVSKNEKGDFIKIFNTVSRSDDMTDR